MEKTDYLDIDGRQLRLLLSIYETGSLTQAAKSLDMNQSTVSYWLERLRYRFKDPLFIRSGAGVIPTQRAESLIPQAKSLLHALKTFSQNDEYTPSEDNGTLKIAVNSVERDLVVQPLLSKAREVAPHLKFEIHATGSNHQVAQGLRDGDFDIAIFPSEMVSADGIMQRRLYTLENAVFYDPEFGSPPKNLDDYCNAQHGVISLGSNAQSSIDSALAKMGTKRNVSLVVSDFDTLAILVKGSDILVTLPKILKLSCFKDFQTTPLPWEYPSGTLAILWHTRQHNAQRNQFWRNLAYEVKREFN
ncbi:LysR family transcriptional regulator [Alteromonadaceae bacterium M269]|nr:LysR family transcriptional regulator [Alteromonadaceae bacterium M269]